MLRNCIRYKSGYKYQLTVDYQHQLPFVPPQSFDYGYISITAEGLLTIRAGYAWDGPSGPTIDTKNFMRGSLVHDALYQCIRLGLLPREFKTPSDQELRRICRQDGMSSVRSWLVLQGVKCFGEASTRPSGARPVEMAP